ncbi:hypothetical protein NPIL_589281 [Nephila pilipes]|uniref:Uncharacterized protein n=1 Tax=Nephila pilipes TaxID=299642 RepID=A0A8X6PBS3_NEPPI|nr:hypothetical protein NPIL_589281 [Nephila pilipes]
MFDLTLDFREWRVFNFPFKVGSECRQNEEEESHRRILSTFSPGLTGTYHKLKLVSDILVECHLRLQRGKLMNSQDPS